MIVTPCDISCAQPLHDESRNDFSSIHCSTKGLHLGHWSCLGLGEEEKWYGIQNYIIEGWWNSTADDMVCNFEDSGHPVFRAFSALDRGFLKKKGGKCTIHFNEESSNAELLFRTNHSADHLSIHRAVANWCDELTQLVLGESFSSVYKSMATVTEQFNRKLELEKVSTLVEALEKNVQAARERLRDHQGTFENLIERDEIVSNL